MCDDEVDTGVRNLRESLAVVDDVDPDERFLLELRVVRPKL